MKATRAHTAVPAPAAFARTLPLSDVEFFCGPQFDRGEVIPPEVIAAILEVAKALWWSEAQGWHIVDPEELAALTEPLSKTLQEHFMNDEKLCPSECFLLQHVTEEITARALACRGVNPKFYAVRMREQVGGGA